MRKRYQLFISSTYEDLKLERQAAVEAILKSGHIPAGMELFTAGDESQYQVIRRWIEQSDIFMLILGARYGSIEPSTGRSYVEAEFTYARELGKPFFSVVLSDAGIEAKVRALGTSVLEQQNEAAYRAFKEVVKSHMCAFFESPKDVKLAVLETLPQIAETRKLDGWVLATEAEADPAVAHEMARLSKENQELRAERDALKDRLQKSKENLASFEDIYTALLKENIKVPADVTGKDETIFSLLELAILCADQLAQGVSNAFTASKFESFIFHKVASQLAVYGLVEHAKTPASVHWQRLKLSKAGIKFFTEAKLRMSKVTSQPEPAVEQSNEAASRKRSATSLRRTVKRRHKKQ